MSERLFATMASTPAMARLVADEAWIRAMLDAESALAMASAEAGVIPLDAGAEIAAACERCPVDAEPLRQGIRDAATPVIALVAGIRAALPDESTAAPFVHRGATTQDIVDTAAALVLQRALALVAGELDAACAAAAVLARDHRRTVMAGRTLLQQAAPTTFGLKAAGWLLGLLDARRQIDRVRHDRVRAQLGGSVGTLAAFAGAGPSVATAYARRLGLGEEAVPWHTRRNAVVDVAAALGAAAGACDKVAVDVVLLAQTEVGEVTEACSAGRGGSSALPQKRNPVGAIGVRAASRRALAAVGGLFASMAHEHERATGAWQAEHDVLVDLLLATHAAAEGVGGVLRGLVVDVDRMVLNLAAGGGTVMAEAAVTALGPRIGWDRAKEIVTEAARSVAGGGGGDLRSALGGIPEVRAAVTDDEFDGLLDPTAFVGSADAFVARALAAYEGGS